MMNPLIRKNKKTPVCPKLKICERFRVRRQIRAVMDRIQPLKQPTRVNTGCFGFYLL